MLTVSNEAMAPPQRSFAQGFSAGPSGADASSPFASFLNDQADPSTADQLPPPAPPPAATPSAAAPSSTPPSAAATSTPTTAPTSPTTTASTPANPAQSGPNTGAKGAAGTDAATGTGKVAGKSGGKGTGKADAAKDTKDAAKQTAADSTGVAATATATTPATPATPPDPTDAATLAALQATGTTPSDTPTVAAGDPTTDTGKTAGDDKHDKKANADQTGTPTPPVTDPSAIPLVANPQAIGVVTTAATPAGDADTTSEPDDDSLAIGDSKSNGAGAPAATLPADVPSNPPATPAANAGAGTGAKAAPAEAAASDADAVAAPGAGAHGHADAPSRPAELPALVADAPSEAAAIPAQVADAALSTTRPHDATAPADPSANPALTVQAPAQSAAPAAANTVAATPNAAAAVPLSDVAVTIAAHADAGNSQFAIRLDPPDLGRIDVQLNVDSSGNVSSHLVVERPETLDLLLRDQPQLERTLQDAGLNATGMQFSLADQGFANRNAYTPSDLSYAAPADPTVVAAPVAALQGYGAWSGRSGGLDITV